MGLDTVEMIMAVEDEFGIAIADDEASEIETVGQLHAYVCHALKAGAKGDRCAGMTAFHRVREALIDAGVGGREINLETDLTSWSSTSPRAWQFFLKSLNLPIKAPPLPAPVHRGLQFLSGGLAVFAIASFLLLSRFGPIFSGLACCAFVTSLLVAWSVGLRRLPPGCGTVRGFVHRYQIILAPPPTSQAVWERLVEILQKQLALPREKITPQAHFYRDLEMG